MASPQRQDPNLALRPAEDDEAERREFRTRGGGRGWFAWWWVWLAIILCALWFAGWGWGGYGGWWWGYRGGYNQPVNPNGAPHRDVHPKNSGPGAPGI